MSLSTNLISGLSSGFDWRSMIDQLIAIEHRRVDLVEAQKTEYEQKLAILQSINIQLLSFKTKADTLSKSDAFNVFTSSLTTDSTKYSASDFLSVSTSTSAAPGAHTIEMNASSSIAQARQISSRSFSSYDTALGLPDDAEFVINGRAVKVDDTDDLMDIRDKINNLNTGANATGVTASILTVSSTDYRLILTSENTGKDAFSILDASGDSVDILQNSSTKPGLGFLDSTTPTIKNITSDGAESDRFSSSEVAVGSLLGLTNAQEGIDITIGGGTVTIDLATQSLSTIAGNIDTGISGVSASVESIVEDGTTKYYIDISGTTNFGDVDNVLQTLGILVGGQGSVKEVHEGSVVNWADVTQTTKISATTTWNSIYDSNGNSRGVANNDTITIKGTGHDGAEVSDTLTITNITLAINDASNNFLQTIQDAFTAKGSNVTVEIVDGKIKVTDNEGGDSQLSLTLICNNQGAGTLDFGTITTSTQGYSMQTAEGKDASIKIDGTTITSSTNIIDDVIAGVTLNLKTVEAGKKVTLTVSRNYDSIKSSVQSLLGAYNDVIGAINEQFAYDEETGSAGLLQGDGTLFSIRSSLQNIVINTITGLPATMNALSVIGITSDNDGMLSMDDDVFMEALRDNFNGARRIFIAEGSTTDGDVEYISHTNETLASSEDGYAVNITTAAEQASVTGTKDLSGGITIDETIVITKGDRTASITLTASGNGKSIDDIVNAINSELDTVYTELWTGTKVNTKTPAAGGGVITSATKWSEINTGDDANNVTDKDTISFEGKTRNGTLVSGTYTIDNKNADTVQGLLSAIEYAYGNNVSANIDADGKLIVTDNTAGNSQFEISVTCKNEGSGSLDFGTMEVTTEGRYAMAITASKDAGKQLVLESDDYGSSQSFTIQVSGSELGLTDGEHSGVDVEGTINGEDATGSGQTLTGDPPAEGETTSVEGLKIKYTGTDTGDQGTVTITMGVGDLFDGLLYGITNEADGYLDYRLESTADRIDDFEDRIEEMEARLDLKMERMINQFVYMELALAQLQNQSNWLASQINSSWSAWGW